MATPSFSSSPLAVRLKELIAFDTRNPGGSEAGIIASLAEELGRSSPDHIVVRAVARGRDAADGGYVFARWGAPRVLVNAHLDTVAIGSGWSGDPFTARMDGARIIGLGAADTKGAIAAILGALGAGRPRDTAVLFSGDEEQGGACMEAFLRSDEARGIEAAIACEPTGCRVGHRHRGILALEIDARGEGGHSSRADALPAPLLELARVASAIGAWGEAQRTSGPPGFLGMCTNIADLRGGIAFNIVPPAATLTLSLRPPPGASLDAIEAELGAIARGASPNVVTRRVLGNPALRTSNVAAFRPLLGEAADAPIDLGFWTEAALLERDGINAVVYGPGAIAQAHAADEWVSLEDLARAEATFAALFSLEKGSLEKGSLEKGSLEKGSLEKKLHAART